MFTWNRSFLNRLRGFGGWSHLLLNRLLGLEPTLLGLEPAIGIVLDRLLGCLRLVWGHKVGRWRCGLRFKSGLLGCAIVVLGCRLLIAVVHGGRLFGFCRGHAYERLGDWAGNGIDSIGFGCRF